MFVAGIYHGRGKPKDVNQFLAPFRDEYIRLKINGLNFDGKNISVSIKGMSCDAPATTFLMNIASHNAYYGCRKCTSKGVWVANISTSLETKRGGRVTHPDVNASLRTDHSFRQRSQIQHHNKNGVRSVAEDLFEDILKAVVIDPMHCVNIGVYKKMLGIWFNDPFDKIRLKKDDILDISVFRVGLSKFVTSDFARKPRAVEDLPRWKATELKLDQNYLGPVVYKKYLSSTSYDHFMLLHVAIRLLTNRDSCRRDANYANDLLRLFVSNSANIYGEKFISHNVHSLIHLSQDVMIHGCLDDFAAFCFENKLQTMKNMLKKSGRPLQQIVRRLDEEARHTFMNQNSRRFVEGFKLEKSHTSGPIIPALISGKQFKLLLFKYSKLSVAIPDNCVLINGPPKMIVLIDNFVKMTDGKIYVVGKKFEQQGDFFTYPLSSSCLDEFLVSGLSLTSESFLLSSVLSKCILLPTSLPETGSFFASAIINMNVN